MRKYFVSYYYTAKNGKQGYGCTELNVHGLVNGWDAILGMIEAVRKKNRFKQVTILYWRRFEEPAALLSAGK